MDDRINLQKPDIPANITPIEQQPHAKCRSALRLALDCMSRAADGLDVAHHINLNWQYITSQLSRAVLYAQRAEAIAALQTRDPDEDSDGPETPLVFPSSDPFLPLPSDGPYGRGGK